MGTDSWVQKFGYKKAPAQEQREPFNDTGPDGLFTKHSLIISLEFGNALVGQRMLCHLLQYLVRNSSDVGSGLGTVDYVNRIADAGSNDFSFNVVHLKISVMS